MDNNLRGFSFAEAFTNGPATVSTSSSATSKVKPTTGYVPEPVTSTPSAENVKDGTKFMIDNKFSKTLIERTDPRGDVTYGLRHAPGANVKLFNASKETDASIAMSFSSGQEMYDDIFKIVKRPTGGYELHLQKISTIVVDGKRIDTTSLASML